MLELTGANKITVKLGESFDEPGYKATDKKGNDITKDVKVSYDDLNKAGNRKLAYTVEDSKGNKTRVFRNVTVEPNTSYQTPGLPICMYHYVYDENDPPEDLKVRQLYFGSGTGGGTKLAQFRRLLLSDLEGGAGIYRRQAETAGQEHCIVL